MITFILIIIFLAAVCFAGYLIHKTNILATKKIEQSFDVFIEKAGFKRINSADEQFNKIRHSIADSTLDLSGYSVDVRQMIYRDFNKFKIYISDISLGAVKGGGKRITSNRTNLYLVKQSNSKERVEIHRHTMESESDSRVLVTGAKFITEGLIPEFSNIFTVKGVSLQKPSLILNEKVQRAILKFQDKYPLNAEADVGRIYIDGYGISILGERTSEEADLKTLVNLAREIAISY